MYDRLERAELSKSLLVQNLNLLESPSFDVCSVLVSCEFSCKFILLLGEQAPWLVGLDKFWEKSELVKRGMDLLSVFIALLSKLFD